METERDLLFGALALDREHIDREQLREACAEWFAQNNGSLADVLVARGWLSSQTRDELERAVEQRLAEHRGNVRAALAAVAETGLHLALEELGAGAGRRTLPYLPPPASYVAVETLDFPPDTRSRYTLTRVHSEGGLGRIWLARDTVLGREIALKEMRHDKETGPAAWQRFVMEAQITGQLEHPNIVPVYELTGGPQRESTFYTMRFLRGRTLGEAVGDYHHRRRHGRADRLELARLLRAFVAVCNAVAFAHARGVIHRDLKPSNVMLGPFGEVVVIDWGLAKVLGRADESDELAVAVTGVAPELATQAGQVIGTVAYMAPEQADGRLELIDGRTDIYALGGMLYAILAGRHPHLGEETNEVLQRIATGPAPRPRDAEPSVPPALDAVCARAMAQRRSERYQTATALADDVERWLADEPVSVYRDPASVRLVRWMRRHRAWAVSSAAALVLVAAVSLVAAALINRARQSEAEALDQARMSLAAEQEAKAEAVRRFRAARRSIDRTLTGVSHVLQLYPGVQALRVQLLAQAAEDYERLGAEKSDDPELQAESGRALLRLGNVHGLLDDWQRAESAYQRAERRFVRLAREWPDQPEFELERLNAQAGRAFALARLGRDDEATRLHDSALAGYDALLKRAPENNETRHARVVAIVNRTTLLMDSGRFAEARRLLEQAEAELLALARSDPQPNFVYGLATAQRKHGEVLQRTGGDARGKLSQAIATFEELVAHDPDDPHHFEGLAATRLALANAWRLLGHDAEEIAVYRETLNDYEALVVARPDVPIYRESRAVTRLDLAQVLHELGWNREARAHLEAARSELERLRSASPLVVAYQKELADCQTALGRVLCELDTEDEAEAAVTGAIQICRELTDAHRDVPLFRRGLAAAQLAAAQLLEKQGRRDSAVDAYRGAIGVYRDVLNADAADTWCRDGLAWAYLHLGNLLFATGPAEDAATCFREALALRDELTDDPDHRYYLAWLLVFCRDPSFCDHQRAVELCEKLTRELPHNSRYWTLLGAAHYRSGRWQDSLNALKRAEEAWAPSDSERDDTDADCFTQFFLAMACHQCGDPEAARAAWDRGRTAMEANRPGHLLLARLRDEAAELLKIPAR